MADAEVTSTDFNAAVQEYRIKQKETMKTFFANLCELGEILSRHRTALKVNSEWMSYLKEIDLPITAANQQIRLYEYAQKTEKQKLLEGVITNWTKCNLFLALEDEQREALLDDTDGTETTAEFRDKVSGIKGDEVEVSEDDLLVTQMESLGITPSTLKIEDSKAMDATAKSLAATLGLSIASLPVVKALLYSVKAAEIIQTTSIPDSDKAMLNMLVKEQQENTAKLQLLP